MSPFFGYYACSYPLGEGSIILPGNWGRIISSPHETNSFQKIKEVYIETVRQYEYPDKPSRLNSLFLCKTIEGMNNFLLQENKHFDIKYLVEITKPEKDLFFADWKQINLLTAENPFDWKNIITCYWHGANFNDCEIVTGSPIKIIQRVE